MSYWLEGSWGYGHWEIGSWGMSYEASQEILLNGGGPDASDSGKSRYREETEEDLEHIELKAKHGRRIYAKDEPQPVVEKIPPSVPRNAELDPARETPGLFYSVPTAIAVDAAAIAADLEDAAESIEAIQALVDERARMLQEEEEMLVLLLAA